MPNGTDDLFTETESLQMCADDIGVERRTVEDWRYTANRWPKERRKEKGVVHGPPQEPAPESVDAEDARHRMTMVPLGAGPRLHVRPR